MIEIINLDAELTGRITMPMRIYVCQLAYKACGNEMSSINWNKKLFN